jgi:hypothetical protein
MGWNDSRVTFLAPGWRIQSDESTGCGPDGSPVRINKAVRMADVKSSAISFDDFKHWLESKGFNLRTDFRLGNVWQREDIEVLVGAEEGTVSEVILTITLTQMSPLELSNWRLFVDEMSQKWDLAVYSPDMGCAVDASEFTKIIMQTRAWQEFASHFRWVIA